MQNNILEQAKVAKKGFGYMERCVQVKRQPVWWDSLKKIINFICKKIYDCMEPSEPVAHFHKMPIKVGQPDKGDDRML